MYDENLWLYNFHQASQQMCGNSSWHFHFPFLCAILNEINESVKAQAQWWVLNRLTYFSRENGKIAFIFGLFLLLFLSCYERTVIIAVRRIQISWEIIFIYISHFFSCSFHSHSHAIGSNEFVSWRWNRWMWSICC